MEIIELRVSPKTWLGYFIVISIIGTGIIIYVTDTLNFTITGYTALIASVLLVGATIGIFTFFQKGVTFTESHIQKLGFPSKTIAYSDIRKITVGLGGYKIHDKSRGSINITKMYSNFNEANLLLNKKIKGRDEIKMIGMKFITDRYFD